MHTREYHLLPPMVMAGAAGADHGERLIIDTVFEVLMASYQSG